MLCLKVECEYFVYLVFCFCVVHSCSRRERSSMGDDKSKFSDSFLSFWVKRETCMELQLQATLFVTHRKQGDRSLTARACSSFAFWKAQWSCRADFQDLDAMSSVLNGLLRFKLTANQRSFSISGSMQPNSLLSENFWTLFTSRVEATGVLLMHKHVRVGDWWSRSRPSRCRWRLKNP